MDAENVVVLTSEESSSVEGNSEDEETSGSMKTTNTSSDEENEEILLESDEPTNESCIIRPSVVDVVSVVDAVCEEEECLIEIGESRTVEEKIIGSSSTLEGDSSRRIFSKKRVLEEDFDEEAVISTKVMKLQDVPVHSQRFHKLEADRRNLREELLETKEKLLYSDRALAQARESIASQADRHHKAIELLKAELLQAKVKNDELLIESRSLASSLVETAIDRDVFTSLQSQLEDCRIKLCAAQEKIKQLESVDIQLLKANRSIRVLQKQLHELEDTHRTVSVSKKKLDNYDSVVCKNEILEQQNTALRQRVGNLDLLRYQLQMEREKCASLEEKLAAFDPKLDKETKAMGEINDDSSSLVVLKYKLLNVQQKEVILTKKYGEMETRLKINLDEIRQLKEKNILLQKQLTIEQEEARVKNDSIQRLERRLRFIVKEREGCVNVLNSYKLDGGVELVLKEQIKELQDTLKRYEDKIVELEEKNNELVKGFNTDSKQTVLISQEVLYLREKISILEEECHQLKQERQKLEELLMKNS